MKKIILLFILLFTVAFNNIAQDYQEAVFLTDGSIIKGFIIEQVPNDYLKIETASGKIYTIEMYEVEKITTERPETRAQNNQTPNGSSQNVDAYNDRYHENRNTSGNRKYDSEDDYEYDDTPRKIARFGVKTGLNLSNVAAEDTDNKVGFTGGVFGEFRFNRFAIQPEFLYSMQGMKGGYNNNYYGQYFESDVKVTLHYLQIPVMAKFYLTDGWCLEAGPQAGFLLAANASVKMENEKISGGIKDLFHVIDFSLNLGTSYQLPRLPLGFYARYSFGFTNLLNIDINEDEFEPGKNRVFQIGAFVSF